MKREMQRRARVLVLLGGLVGLAGMASDVDAQNPGALRITFISAPSQTTEVGQLFPQPLSVKLTDDQGVPFAGAPVLFANNGCASFSGSLSKCSYTGSPGHFPDGTNGAQMATDSLGVATTPYIAGTSAGSIGVFVYPIPKVAPYYFQYSPAVNAAVVFSLNQTPSAIPALSYEHLLFTCFLVAAIGIGALRAQNVG